MTDTRYLNAMKTYATLINAGKRTAVPTVYIVGCAQGIINGSYTIDDVPEVLQEAVQAKVTDDDVPEVLQEAVQAKVTELQS